MSKTLLISDANILIDMDAGGLLEPMFSLEYTFATPDMLYQEELAELHPHLLDMGLKAMELSEDTVQQLVEFSQTYGHTGVSSYDLASMGLAQQEQAPLLTGDRKLHQVCIQENVEVHGSLWLVNELHSTKIVSFDEIELAYERMKADGSRLPWDEVKNQLKRFRKKK
ncbi:MAG: DUF3368 domain-containing protein [Gammaproteobacteria bacterium]|nr:DUF3368 domain-containing protein [Gammaproteobacteria bacterium]